MEINASKQQTPQQNQILGPAWRGLGFWNFYFLGKFALYLTGYINFDLFYNALFFAALVFPLRPLWLHRLRQYLAIPIGIAVLYHDTWFPPFSRLLAQPEVLHFSSHYLLELIGRFINWNLLGAGFIFLVVYLFLAQWFRLTLFTVLGLLIIALSTTPQIGLPGLQWQSIATINADKNAMSAVANTTTTAAQANHGQQISLNDLLDAELETFYQAEASRHISFPTPNPDATNFDLVFLNICSISWADLEETNLLTHPLFEKMDIIFDDFNAATSYSGPAVSRLLQANCGQQPHQQLYEDGEQHCSLFENLRSIGFDTSIALNHDGEFQRFIDDLAREDSHKAPLIPNHLKPVLRSFDSSPIWDDLEVLNLWLEQTAQTNRKPAALLYNSITLHDGNREATADGGSQSSPYAERARRLLTELVTFIEQLEHSKRKVVLVFIPEHGAALSGDRMQISGMREIPTPPITHVPVGVRLIGTHANAPSTPIHVENPSSFLALADLISRIIDTNVFAQDTINWAALTQNLEQTQAVSENEGVVVMQHEGRPYVRMQGRNWVEYKP